MIYSSSYTSLQLENYLKYPNFVNTYINARIYFIIIT